MRIPDYRVSLEEGQEGSWRIETFTINSEDARFYNNIRAKTPEDRVTVGEYTRLIQGTTTWMSDTPMEQKSHVPFITKATGQVFISGLGIGMAVAAVMKKEEVTRVDVIEKSPEVISLVAHQLKDKPGGDKLTVIEADAFHYTPPPSVRYDVGYHDIWENICGDNWPDYVNIRAQFHYCIKKQILWRSEMVRRLHTDNSW